MDETENKKLMMRYFAAFGFGMLAVVAYHLGQKEIALALMGFAGVQLPTGDILNRVGV